MLRSLTENSKMEVGRSQALELWTATRSGQLVESVNQNVTRNNRSFYWLVFKCSFLPNYLYPHSRKRSVYELTGVPWRQAQLNLEWAFGELEFFEGKKQGKDKTRKRQSNVPWFSTRKQAIWCAGYWAPRNWILKIDFLCMWKHAEILHSWLFDGIYADYRYRRLAA